jgi:hypothetical protein
VVILTVLVLIAAGALYLTWQKEPTVDHTLGGFLFPADVSEIEGLLVTRQGSQFRLDRHENEVWSLSGAVTDYVDSLAVLKLLDTLSRAVGGPLLPGTEVEDRRYGFNGPEAIRLTMFVTGGEAISLALGTANPVAGQFYASGAGRSACFLVSPALRRALDELPGFVQARIILPGVNRDKVERVDLRRGDRDFLIERRDGRWWMLMPTEGPAFLGEEVRDYQAMYDDRRTTDEQGTWILASSAAMNQMIYQVSDIIVRDIKSPLESATLREAWGLDPPWRMVTLSGKGLNSDPSAETPDRMVISFGPALDWESVPVLRRGNVLVTEPEALLSLEQPLGFLAHRTALTFPALQADTIELEREGHLLLSGERTGVAETAEGRKAWLTTFPPQGALDLSETDRNGFIQDLAVSLERVAVLAVLPPTGEPTVLAERERVKITVSFATEEGGRSEVMEVGYLVADHLPAGSPPLVRTEDGLAPVGLWFPASGKLLQIPGQFVVTARNLVQFALGGS